MRPWGRARTPVVPQREMRLCCGRNLILGHLAVFAFPAHTVVVPDENTDSVFYEYAFKTSQMLHSFRKHSQGLTSDTWNLKFPLFAEIEVRSPCLPEQQKIGAYFRSLDALLAARREEIGNLKQMKKALLESVTCGTKRKFAEVNASLALNFGI